MSKPITKRQAEAALSAVRRQFKSWILEGDTGPVLVQNFAGEGHWAIVWEDNAPYEWAHLAFDGGRDEEFGFKIEPVDIPKGVFPEPYYPEVLGLYPAA